MRSLLGFAIGFITGLMIKNDTEAEESGLHSDSTEPSVGWTNSAAIPARGDLPRIYISSTIYDFCDLRSALKYWLEELGFDVMLSEFNDFTKPLDQNSYHACLRAVESADYFVLLIGARVGGFFDARKKLSITRMEYQEAYKLVHRGRMKLLTFVRQDLWNVREDRNGLKQVLINDHKLRKELSQPQIDTIVHHSSNLVNDAETIFDFIREVVRADEMKRAIAGQGPFPIGNWVHQFSTFNDIVETIRSEFNISTRLSRVALATNLKRELTENLIRLSEKQASLIILRTTFIARARPHFKGELDSSSAIPGRELSSIARFILHGSRWGNMSTQFLDQALISGEFLEYDKDQNAFTTGLISEKLFDLKAHIERLRSLWAFFTPERIVEFIEELRPLWNSDGAVIIANIKLLPVFTIYDCEFQTALLCLGLIKAIDGNSELLSRLRFPDLNPLADQEINSATITRDEMSSWINNFTI